MDKAAAQARIAECLPQLGKCRHCDGRYLVDSWDDLHKSHTYFFRDDFIWVYCPHCGSNEIVLGLTNPVLPSTERSQIVRHLPNVRNGDWWREWRRRLMGYYETTTAVQW